VSYAWIAPAVVAVAGLPIVIGLARRAAEEAAGLRRDLQRFGDLQPALVEVATAARQLQGQLPGQLHRPR
jgi:hypothetical protein